MLFSPVHLFCLLVGTFSSCGSQLTHHHLRERPSSVTPSKQTLFPWPSLRPSLCLHFSEQILSSASQSFFVFFFSLFHFSVTCLFIIRLSMSSTRTKTTCLMTMFSCHQHSARHTGGVQRLLTIEQVSCVICKMTAPGASKMSPQERKKK